MNNEYKEMVEELKNSLSRAKANRAHDYYVDSSETAINALEKAITMLQMINMKVVTCGDKGKQSMGLFVGYTII